MKFTELKDMRYVLFFLLINVSLSGCDTMSRYNAKSSQGAVTDAPSMAALSRQNLVLDRDQVSFEIRLSRFNFNMGVDLRVKNVGESPITFNPSEVKLTSRLGKELPLVVVRKKFPLKNSTVIEDMQKAFLLGPGEAEFFNYVFNGAPVMGAISYSELKSELLG